VKKHLIVGRWLAFGLLLACAAGASVGAPPAAGSAQDCLSFQREEGERSLTFHTNNACQRRLYCRMSYRLSCQGPDGKETAASDKQYGFGVGASETATLTISAEPCKQSWTISDVDWHCA
jgi:hypothetical protein